MWFFVALIVGAGLLALAWFLKSRGVSVKWWEWILIVLGVLVLLFTIQNATGASLEWEPAAARVFWIFGLIATVILLAIPGVFICLRNLAKS